MIDPTVIHLGRPRAVLTRGLVLLTEVVAVPGALLYAFTSAGHPAAGMVAVFAWRTSWIGVRRTARRRVPTTCWFAFALFLARTITGIAVSSVALYLLIPVALSAAQGALFLASGFSRRPLLMRLAADYTDDIPDRSRLRAGSSPRCQASGARSTSPRPLSAAGHSPFRPCMRSR